MSKTFASLSVPNYRKYFIGISISNVGQWMARTAQSWLVLVVLTGGDATALGWMTAFNFAPTLLLVPLAGRFADRYSKRTIMNVAQIVLGVDAAILAVLVLSGNVQLWHVFLLTTIDGIAAAFDGPARAAFVSEIVPLSQLPNAISLNSASFNAARLIGPGVGGLLIAAFGTGPVLAINILSFVSLVVSLSLLNKSELHPARAKAGSGGLREGVKYVRNRPDLMILLAVAFVMGAFGFNFGISNAVMATEAFGKGAGEYGLLGSWMGLGALTAALAAARRKRPRIRFVLSSMALFTAMMLLSSIVPSYWMFALLLVPVGFAAITTTITANAMVQMSVEPAMRGRVMSLWGALILGGTPIVSPLIGWLGDAFGPRWTVLAQAIPVGITFVLLTWWIMSHERIAVRIDLHKPAPWLRLVRGTITEELNGPIR